MLINNNLKTAFIYITIQYNDEKNERSKNVLMGYFFLIRITLILQ